MTRWISYRNYQFWVFAVGGGLFALAYGTVWPRQTPTARPYELALAMDPDYALGHYNLGTAAQAANNLEAARAHYAAAAEADPHDHTRCFNHAQVALRLGQLDEALAAARCAVAADGGGDTYDLLGQILVAKEDLAAAIPALEEALRLRPGFAASRIELGLAYARTDRMDDAETTLRLAVAQRPDLAEAWFNLGLVIWRRGDAEGAYRDFEVAVAMNPQLSGAMGNLAAIDAEAGRIAPAVRWLDRMLVLEPGNQDARRIRADLSARPHR